MTKRSAISATGTALVYSTYLGGSSDDYGEGIAVDSAGNAYVTGSTKSSDFPTANAMDGILNGSLDAFLTKLNPGGTTLVYSTYLGGSLDEIAEGIAVDSAGNAHVFGRTNSVDFPTVNPSQSKFGGGQVDAFVAKFTAAGTTLAYSTYLGGSLGDDSYGIALDVAGNAYITGSTESADFPTVNAFQGTRGGGTGANFDAFVAKISDPSGNGVAEKTLGNISTRLAVLDGENVLIGGFILVGDVPKKVIFRALGPSLGAAGVNGALEDPVLELFRDSTLLARNENWRDDQEAAIVGTGVAPRDDREAAIVRTIEPGVYTAILRGAGGTTGIALVEGYDLDQRPDSKLANISTRGFVATGNNVMIGGFIVGPTTRVVVRALGPSLGNAGIQDALQDPALQVVNENGTLVSENDDWQGGQRQEIEAIGIAPSDPRESALVATLTAGSYTAVVRGVRGTSGVGLVEIYNIQ
jgi:hypothetical protein